VALVEGQFHMPRQPDDAAAKARGVKFGRKRKLSDYQRAEVVKRRSKGETLAAIAKSYGVAISMNSRLCEPAIREAA
jgi:Helix-turn-helix domain of resolvase